MTLLPFKLKTLALLGSVAVLTACSQPTTSQTSPEHTTEATKTTTTQTSNSSASVTPDPHAGHDMSHMSGMASSGNAKTNAPQPAHVTEYMQSMTTMHDQMMSATHIVNPDVAFATGMIAHHQGAVEMAKIQLKYGKDNQMRTLAETIIKAQQAEIQEMQTWLEKHKNDKANTAKSMPEMDMQSHNAMMQGIMESDPDIAFAKGMIPHHQGAIDMANIQLKMGKDNAMLDLAKRIKSAQDPEIKQMQAWLATKGVK